MKRLAALCGLFLSGIAAAHHTRDHMMLGEDAGQVIAATHEGGNGLLWWMLWLLLAVVLLLGVVRWWQRRT
jgi:uncharacterized iron-regulated membrane protein